MLLNLSKEILILNVSMYINVQTVHTEAIENLSLCPYFDTWTTIIHWRLIGARGAFCEPPAPYMGYIYVCFLPKIACKMLGFCLKSLSKKVLIRLKSLSKNFIAISPKCGKKVETPWPSENHRLILKFSQQENWCVPFLKSGSLLNDMIIFVLLF